MRERSEIYERYALGLARPRRASAAGGPGPERERLLAALAARGIRGRAERMTLYTRGLPRGCRACLRGRGSNLVVTGLCNRACFFCFNPQPRVDETVVHGRRAEAPEQIAAALRERGIRSVGLSGGEPLLFAERTLRIVAGLRREFGRALRIDLYTNGDLLSAGLLGELKAAGLDALRVDLAANGYNLDPVALALGRFAEVDVEMPAIPGHGQRLRTLVTELDRLGASHLILHELFSCAQNAEAVSRRGLRPKPGPDGGRLMWEPVDGSEELVLETLLHALGSARRLSVYYCSCATQDWIAENALARCPGP